MKRPATIPQKAQERLDGALRVEVEQGKPHRPWNYEMGWRMVNFFNEGPEQPIQVFRWGDQASYSAPLERCAAIFQGLVG